MSRTVGLSHARQLRWHTATFETLELRAVLQASPFIAFTGNLSGNPANIGTPALPALVIQTAEAELAATPANFGNSANSSGTVGGGAGASVGSGSPSGSTLVSAGSTAFGLQTGTSVNLAPTDFGAAGAPTSSTSNGLPAGTNPSAGSNGYSDAMNRLIQRLADRSGIAGGARNSSGGANITTPPTSSAVPVVPPSGNDNP